MARSTGKLALWQHPLAFNSYRHWCRLRRANGGVEPQYRLRSAVVSLLSPISAPMRILERVRCNRSLKTVQVHPSPLFIVGYWRSGTTHLHNLLTQDPAFGYVSTLQAMTPEMCLVGRWILRPIMLRTLPSTRPMDNMAFSPDLPQEEEMAICVQSQHSYYTSLFFPRYRRLLFAQYGLGEGITPHVKQEWESVYLSILQKATLLSGGKRLVLKNPANTGRIPTLLGLFPEAKIIHIFRNPYHVFLSAKKLMHDLREALSFQYVDDKAIETDLLYFYQAMMQRYLTDREAIPPENRIEVRYEDLEKSPMEELRRIYDVLGLDGWETVRKPLEDYLASQVLYRKNHFVLSSEDIKKVEQHWQFALDAFGYSRPEQNGA